MKIKVRGLVRSCGECPDYVYYSGGKHQCRLVEETVVDKTIIAPFCPLADFPSQLLADMETTIRTLREPNKYGIVLAVLSHIATKLNENLNDRGGLTISLKNGDSVSLWHDYITEVSVYPWAVHFVDGARRFKFFPDANPPELYTLVTVSVAEEQLWQKLDLA